jgi:hypothetical protein
MTSHEPRQEDPDGRRANVAQLRADIDSGKTGDKVGGLDPAAAPLGTDDEAAGTPPSPETVAAARAAEGGPHTASQNAATPSLAPNGRGQRGSPWIGIIGGAAAAILAVGCLALFL